MSGFLFDTNEIEKRTIVTSDAARYRTYFPNVPLIAPA
jgi:hypothetical protein